MRTPPNNNGVRGTRKQWQNRRAQRSRAMHAAPTSTSAATNRKYGKKSRAALQKQNQRLKHRIRQITARHDALRQSLLQQNEDRVSQLLKKALEAECNLTAVIAALQATQKALAERKTDRDKVIDFRLPNCEYETEFQIS